MKCEGNKHHAKNIEAIVKAGIPVQGHIGITPMRMPQLGGFFAQGKTADRAKELIDDAWAMVDAGCFSIMCEVTTSEVCQMLAETLPVPVVSLGAGNAAHGVHIIGSDLFHLYEKHTPRHSKIYTDLVPILEKGLSDYRDDVRARRYPGPEHTVFMKPEELERFSWPSHFPGGVRSSVARDREPRGALQGTTTAFSESASDRHREHRRTRRRNATNASDSARNASTSACQAAASSRESGFTDRSMIRPSRQRPDATPRGRHSW